MKENGEPETEFEAAMPLFANIIEANARGLQWTNDQLLASKEQELLRSQRDFVKLYNALTKVYDKTDSGTARDALDRFYTVYNDFAKAVGVTKDSYGNDLDLDY